MIEILSAVGVSIVIAVLAFAITGAFLKSGSGASVSPEKLCILVASVSCLIGMPIAFNLSFSKNDMEEARHAGYNEGYSQGYSVGYEAGVEQGSINTIEYIEWKYGIDVD